ncbi:MAG: hypothetical protein ABI594_07530 [Ginsengibacter sp.]
MDKTQKGGRINNQIIPLIFIVATIISCHSKQNFDKTKWQEVGDLMTFPNRNAMVEDLLKNYDLKGKTFNDITNLLGQPQYPLNSIMEIGYKIEEDYGNDIDPIFTKTLFIQFDKDTIFKTFGIKEWKK